MHDNSTMKEIQKFTNPEFGDIRVMRNDCGEPLFVAADICESLGLGQVTNAIKRLDEDERTLISIKGRDVNAVNEAGLYALVLSSRKPEARAFKRWVTHEVLPAIRRDGGYVAVDGTESEQELVAKALVIVKGQLDAARGRIAEMEPKALFADAMLPAEGLFTVTEAARQVANVVPGVSRQDVFDLLRRYNVMCADGTQPTRRGVDSGRMRQVVSEFVDADGVTRAKARGKLTAKGIAWLVAKLAEGRAS